MKGRESGMPGLDQWESYFDPDEILTALKLNEKAGDVVDFGCGYGTFSIQAAQRIAGKVYGFDIEPEMIAICQQRARELKLKNTKFILRDFVHNGTGLPDNSVSYVMLFNILHIEEPIKLLREALRILQPGGIVAVIHWNYDARTPRGPSMAIRPKPEDCMRWIEASGAQIDGEMIDLPPYHYGWLGLKR